jgi:hypothetical protein
MQQVLAPPVEIVDLEALHPDELALVASTTQNAIAAVTARRRAAYAEYDARVQAEYSRRWGAPDSEERAVLQEFENSGGDLVIDDVTRARLLHARRIDTAVRIAVERHRRRLRRASRRRHRPRALAAEPDGDDDPKWGWS